MGNETQQTLVGHTSLVSRLEFNDQGTLVASSSSDCTGRIWRLDSAELISQELKGHKHGISDICWHPDQGHVATAADDMTLALWDVGSGKKMREFKGHTHFVYCCKFHPHGGVLMSGSLDESVRLWDIRSGHCIKTIPAHADPVTEMDCTRDGTLLATCSSDGLSRLWDFRTGRLLRTLLDTECSAPITSLHFCPNGRYLLEAVLQENALVRVWDWQQLEGTVVRRLHGHQNSTYSVPARFVYGAWAASASEDGRVVLWHINSGKMETMDFNTLPDSLEKAGSASAPAADGAAQTAAGDAAIGGADEDVQMADADTPAGAADDAGGTDARNERKPHAGAAGRRASRGSVPGGAAGDRKAANAAKSDGKAGVGEGGMPRPCAINAMSIHEASQRIALTQIGRPDYSITVASFPEPSA